MYALHLPIHLIQTFKTRIDTMNLDYYWTFAELKVLCQARFDKSFLLQPKRLKGPFNRQCNR